VALSVAHRSILDVVGGCLSDSLVPESRVEGIVTAGSGLGRVKLAVLLSIDTELPGVTVDSGGALPLFAP